VGHDLPRVGALDYANEFAENKHCCRNRAIAV
jgi:hypothetical protein